MSISKKDGPNSRPIDLIARHKNRSFERIGNYLLAGLFQSDQSRIDGRDVKIGENR